MQLKYSKEAEAAGIHVVGACGFDSIPADCGLEFLKSKFDGGCADSFMTSLEEG